MFRRVVMILALFSTQATGSTYRHSMTGERLASDFFGGYYGDRALKLDAGNFSVVSETTVDCGKIDFNLNVGAMFKNIKNQMEGLVNMWKGGDIARSLGAIALAKAYPSVYAFLTENNARIDEKLNLRYNMCRDIDKYLKGQAEEGKKELQSRAQKECIKDTIRGGETMAVAIQRCQNRTGLPIVDFANAYRDARTRGSQKTLKALVNFAKRNSSDKGYNRLASVLGEIQVSSSGYWEPLFDEKILYTDSVVDESTALARGSDDCKFQSYYTRTQAPDDPMEKAVWKVTRRYFKKEHNDYLKIMGGAEKKLCCQFISKSIGTQASKEFGIELDGTMKAALMHPKVPDDLKKEFEVRTERAVQGILLAAENSEAASVPEALQLLVEYGKLVQQKSELVGRRSSAGRINSDANEMDTKSCTDSISCSLRTQD